MQLSARLSLQSHLHKLPRKSKGFSLAIGSTLVINNEGLLYQSIELPSPHNELPHLSTMLPSDIHFPPYQGHCVKLSVINAAKSRMQAGMLVTPAPANNNHFLDLAGYSFLIESTHREEKVLFDLAFMKDVVHRAPPFMKPFLENKALIEIEEHEDVSTVLSNQGVPLSSINSIIWSHAHIDHTGDPSTFPSTTSLVVGPGFKQAHMPGYPKNPLSTVLESAYEGRSVREVVFTEHTSIGGFRAIDYFGDASFWLLETPGHTTHHLGALCRTTKESFVLLGGDACHTVAQLRPSVFRTLPGEVPASVLGRSPPPEVCSCAGFRRHLKPGDGSFYGLAPGMQEDLGKAQDTIEKLKAFDGRDDVLIVIAHDASLLDVLEFHPGSMNDWKAKGWAKKGRWLFLKDIETATKT